MMNDLRKLVVAFIVPMALASGCVKTEEIPTTLDRLAFQYIGGTLFTNPETMTLKEIHLDSGSLGGREIIIEGRVAEVSPHSTYVVLTDDTARMLVVLTDITTDAVGAHNGHPTALRVLGTIEAGKKGLPFVRAISVSAAKEGVATGPTAGKA